MLRKMHFCRKTLTRLSFNSSIGSRNSQEHKLVAFVSVRIGIVLFHRSLPSQYCSSLKSVAMELDEGRGMVESSAERASFDTGGDGEILEPYEGMEFESEEAAKVFYDDYSRRVGFVMRVMSCRRSEVDGRILARRFGCNKEGYCVSIRGKFGQVRKPRTSTREGCKAMVLVKVEKSGKWVVTKFVRDHNHPLVVSSREARQTLDDKDKKIQELTAELRNKKRLCAMYEERLMTIIKDVEEHNNHLTKIVQTVLGNIKEAENKETKPLNHG